MPSPITPTGIQINSVAEDGSYIVTNNISGSVTISAVIDDADSRQTVRLVVRYSADLNFAHYYQKSSGFGAQARRASVVMDRLTRNTRYYVRVYTQDHSGKFSGVNRAGFWTDRYPDPPTLITPVENAEYFASASIPFDWQVNDPDDPDSQRNGGWQIQWRQAGSAAAPPGPWSQKTAPYVIGSTTSWAMPANMLKAGITYEWHVRTRDPQSMWGQWSVLRSLSTSGATHIPVPLTPAHDVVLDITEPITFKWKFSDPLIAATQGNANLRYRVKGTSTWVTLFGSALTDQEWAFDPDTFAPGYHYEWQVQTTRSSGSDPDSDWSTSATFWTILTPGSAVTEELPLGSEIRGQLGTGTYRVFIYDRGGAVRRGEIPVSEISQLTWGRKRDDISGASIDISNFSDRTKELLKIVHTWAHELVIERDRERVWEGPVTLITDDASGVFTISARDVMAYAYRRIMRQGYDDSYRVQAGFQVGNKTVVERAGIILVNALGYAEPNVLPYLTLLTSGADAGESRIVPDYIKSAWEEVDDLGQNAGLDYTVIGRRTILWGTHSPVGVLPEMSDDNFTEPVKVTEYGMNASNYYAVTDGQGAWGAAYPVGKTAEDWDDFYGPLEMIDSGYGVTDTTDTVDDSSLTPQALAALQADLTSQAQRNIATRWPAPLTARVPDNAGVKPDTNITMGQLIPGVWIPLRVKGTVRPFAQMQKLDSVSVTVQAGNETVGVVMGPAPLSAEDPDLNGADDSGDDA